MMTLVGIGGAFGAAARYWIGMKIPKTRVTNGIWLANITGSFILGILANLHYSQQLSEWIWALFGIGFCGAFTTFSTFSVEAIQWVQDKQLKCAILYVVSSVLISITFAAIGYFI